MLKNTVDRRLCSTSVSHVAKIDYNHHVGIGGIGIGESIQFVRTNNKALRAIISLVLSFFKPSKKGTRSVLFEMLAMKVAEKAKKNS